MACQEATEAYLERKEPTPVKMANVVAHSKILKEEAAVETIGALEDRYGDQNLAVRRS
jgi:hypothetical protein